MTVLTFTANDPDKSTISVINGSTVTGYAISDDGPDFGAANFSSVYAGQRGTQGAKPGFGVPDNRTVTLPLRVYGTSKDNMATRLSALVLVVDKMRRFGGTILWKSSNATYRVYFRVLASGASLKKWDNTAESSNRIDLISTFTCAPYALGDPMDTFDGFDTNTLATDWTSDINTAGAVVVGGTVSHTVTTALIWRARHTVKGYGSKTRDVQVTLKVNTGTSITSAVWGVAARMDTAGADTMLVAELVAGTNVIRLRKFEAGTPTAIGGAGTAITPAVSSTYWVRIRTEGNVVTAEAWATAPTPTGTPTATVSYTMTTAESAKFYTGDSGVRITTASTVTTETYDDFTVEPMTYRLLNAPEEIVLSDGIPGDAPALADIVVSPLGGPASALAGSAPVWGKASWHERPPIYNLCYAGDFEDSTVGVSGWSVAAVTTLQANAATSIARDTTAANVKYGTACAKIVCPATANTGGNFAVYHRAKTGRTYAVLMWVSASATTNASLFLGLGSNNTIESAAALTTAIALRCITWTPTADTDTFYGGIKITAATATNIFIDAINILEVPTIALSAAIASAGALTMTVYSNPAELPSVPFNVIVGTEIIRVTDASTTTWTILRGLEGSTAATHSADDAVVLLPASRLQYEGRGAVPPLGIIEGESYVSGLSSATTGALSVTADTAGRGGNKLRWSAGASGSATAEWFIDPSLVIPDDYATGYNGGEVDIEVWARIEMINTLASPSTLLSAIPEGGTTKGAERFSREYSQSTKPLTLPSAQNYRYVHLGTIPMFVDRANPLRWILKLILAQTSTGAQFNVDYIYLNVSRWRVCSITGKAYNSNFPQFIPYDAAWSNTSTMTKTLKADGTAYINEAAKPTYPDNGLGRTIELPASPVNAVVKLSNRIPDDTTAAVDKGDMDDDAGTAFAGTTGGAYTTTVHFAVTPRFLVVRGS